MKTPPIMNAAKMYKSLKPDMPPPVGLELAPEMKNPKPSSSNQTDGR
jgi:hypothetical protein